MTRIIERLSVEDLEQRYRAAQDATEARHTQAISPKRAAFAAGLLAQGRSVLDVAGVLAFNTTLGREAVRAPQRTQP